MESNTRKIPSIIFAVTVVASLFYGWMHRDSNYISAETGAGYLLGIIGGSMMLILLLYPVSKRVSLLTRLIPLRYWFGIHMTFGIIGPLLILFHANFQLGSVNSNVALFCMLIVAGSGLVGRYIYTRIHHGLYGERIQLKEFKDRLRGEHEQLFSHEGIGEGLGEQLAQLEQKTLQPYTGVFPSLAHLLRLGSQSGKVKRAAADIPGAGRDPQETGEAIERYFNSLRHIAAFRLYERLFSLWHIFHLPLFIMMLITAVVHVFAVHLY